MSEQEFNGILAASFLVTGFVCIVIAALIEKRWRDTANTCGIVGLSMWVMAFLTAVKS